MTATYDKQTDRYFVCPQCGPYAMGYGNYTTPNCYGGDCSTLNGEPQGPYYQCAVRERLRDFYANGVQGGTPACKTARTDVQSQSGLFPPFATYAVNYWGDLDPDRMRPYDVGYGNVGVKIASSTQPDSSYEAGGHYVQQMCLTGSCQTNPAARVATYSYKQPLLTLPVPGMREVKTLDSVEFPGTDNICTQSL